MRLKPIENIKTLEEATLELANAERTLKDLPKKVFKEVLVLTGLAILFPLLPGKR